MAERYKKHPEYECIFHSLYMKKLECASPCSVCVYNDAKHSGDAEILLVTNWLRPGSFLLSEGSCEQNALFQVNS